MKLKSKGATLALSVASVYTPITQLTSLSMDGAEVETFEGTVLEQESAFKDYPVTGYTEPGSVSFEGFYDTNLASHQALANCLANPDDYSWRMGYSSGATQDFVGGGVSLGVTADPGDGLKFSGGIQISGDPGFITSGTGT